MQLERPKKGGTQISKEELVSWMDAVLEVFMDKGKAEALSYLEGNISPARWPGPGPALLALVDELATQLRTYFDTYERILRSAGDARKVIVHPVLSERTLLPMTWWTWSTAGPSGQDKDPALLLQEDNGLSALGRSLGLQKGHLQFHLRALASSGYIVYDGKSHLYSISSRGRRALDNLVRMYEDLR
jgi:hypothetical protein